MIWKNSSTAPPDVQADSARFPPGRQTRASSDATARWSGAKIAPTDDVTMSKLASGYGSASASPTSNVTSTPRSAACLRAVSTRAGDRSAPVTVAPVAAAMKASSPVPQPTSSQSRPGAPSTAATIASCMSASVPAMRSNGAEPHIAACRSFSSSNAIGPPSWSFDPVRDEPSTQRSSAHSVHRMFRGRRGPAVPPRLAEVEVPEQARRARAVRPPRLADHLELGRRRALVEPPRATSGLLQGDVPDGPRVGPPERGEEVDLRRPGADPRERDERVTDAVVVEQGHRVEVERPVEERRGQRAHVPVLLAAEPVGAQLLVGREDDAVGRDAAEPCLQPVVGGLRRGEGDLLLEDQQDERREPGLAGPELGKPMCLDDRREIGVCGAQLRGSRGERRLVEHPLTLHSGRPAIVQRARAPCVESAAWGRAGKGGDMNHRHIWLAVVVLAAASALAATGAFAATGNTQVDGIQTTVTVGDLDDPTDDVFWMDGNGGGKPGLIEGRLVGEVGERRPAPQREGLAEDGRRCVGIASLEGSASLPCELLEALEVERSDLDPKDVPGPLGLDRLLAERLAETRHVALHEVRRGSRWALPPQPVDQLGRRYERVRAAGEESEHRTLLRGTEWCRTTAHGHFEGAEHAVLDGHRPTLLPADRGVDVAERHALGYGGVVSRVPEISSILLPGLALRLLLLPR